MNDGFYSTEDLKLKYGISPTSSKSIAGKASDYITNFGEKIDGSWRFTRREVAFMIVVRSFTRELTPDGAFSAALKMFYNIDCNRSNHRL